MGTLNKAGTLMSCAAAHHKMSGFTRNFAPETFFFFAQNIIIKRLPFCKTQKKNSII